MTHAVMDKMSWLIARGIAADWPARGIPRVIHVDNGAEFHALRSNGPAPSMAST